MTDMNRLLIFLLLVGLLYALYKYQHIIFGDKLSLSQGPQGQYITQSANNTTRIPIVDSPQINYKQISSDNISQFTLESFEEDNAQVPFSPDSLLGSLDSCSLNATDNATLDSLP